MVGEDVAVGAIDMEERSYTSSEHPQGCRRTHSVANLRCSPNRHRNPLKLHPSLIRRRPYFIRGFNDGRMIFVMMEGMKSLLITKRKVDLSHTTLCLRNLTCLAVRSEHRLVVNSKMASHQHRVVLNNELF